MYAAIYLLLHALNLTSGSFLALINSVRPAARYHSGGKVLRINRDGSIPADNMGVLADGIGGQLDHVWAKGLRNGYSSRWDLATDRFFIAEVGGNNQDVAVEDLHLGKAGANYGW